MNAKRFFYVAAGVLLLVVAYSVGAHRAGAQAPGQFAAISYVDPSFSPSTVLAITSEGDVYFAYAGNDGSGPWAYMGKAGSGNFVGISGRYGDCAAITGDGSVYENHNPTGRGWFYSGNVLGGTVNVESKSWSDVKSTYRK